MGAEQQSRLRTNDPDQQVFSSSTKSQSMERNSPSVIISNQKFLTNSDKSFFNIKWVRNGPPQPKQRLSRSEEENQSTTHYRQYEHHGTPQTASDSDRSKKKTSSQIAPPKQQPQRKRYSPFDSQRQKSKPKEYVRPRLVARVIHTNESINLFRGTDALKREHHYADTPEEVDNVVRELKQKGFVETGGKSPVPNGTSEKK